MVIIGFLILRVTLIHNYVANDRLKAEIMAILPLKEKKKKKERQITHVLPKEKGNGSQSTFRETLPVRSSPSRSFNGDVYGFLLHRHTGQKRAKSAFHNISRQKIQGQGQKFKY